MALRVAIFTVSYVCIYVYISNAVSHLHPNPAPVSSTNSNHNQDNVEPSLAAQEGLPKP